MKRFVPMILAAALFSAVPCAVAYAETALEDAALESYASGTYYEEWNLWFDKTSGRITGCDSNAQSLTLPAEIDGVTVTGITDSAFKDCKLQKIILPETLIHIGYRAFENCTELTEITIPKSVTANKTTNYSLDYYGNWFVGCTSLKKVTFESGTTQILRECLENSNVSEIMIPDTVTAINYQAFKNNANLKNITLPESVTFISEEAFGGCSSLENIVIPQYVSKICDWAFSGCSSLKSVTFDENLTYLGYEVFKNCTSLTEMTIPKTVASNKTTYYSLDYYGNWFVGCTSLKKVTFENGTSEILRECLENSNVSEIIIPDTVTAINYQAFKNNTNLKNITLPESLTFMSEEVFNGCTALESITIPKYVTKICDWAFGGCSSLKNVTLSENLTYLGYEAFKNCTMLTKITIPKAVANSKTTYYSLDYYGNWFTGCTLLKNVVFENGTTYIPREALANSKISTVVLPESLESIGYKAFSNCINLKTIKIPENVTSLGDGAFSGCSKLEKAMFKGDAPEITGISSYYGIQLFKNCYTEFEINYLNGKTGWTEPEWNGYPCVGVDAYDDDEPEYVYGDANGDGVLTAADSADILQKVLNGTYRMNIEDIAGDKYLAYADVNLDGSLTSADSAIVLQKVLNGSFKMPVEE